MKNISPIIGFIAFSTFLSSQEWDCSEDQTEPSRECIAYSPQYYELQCDWGIFLTLDFLYWHARESDLAWCSKAIVKNFGGIKGVATPLNHINLDAEWSPGIRIGIGWNMECDGWDLYLNWLYFHNATEDSAHYSWNGNPIPDIGQEALYNPWAYGSWFPQSFWQNGKAKWALNFDQMDLELGKKFWLTRCFTLRPYGGLRATWMHTRFRVYTELTFPGLTQINPDLLAATRFIPGFQNNANFFRNAYWGIGPLGGLQPNWAFCSNWFIFGNFSGSLVWGRFWGSNVVRANFQGVQISNENGPVPREFSLKNHEKNGYHRMQAMLDLALGLRWEEHWCSNRFSTSLDISWENHFWLNFGLRYQSTGSFDDDTLQLLNINGNVNSYYLTESALVTDLTLGGLVIRGRVDF